MLAYGKPKSGHGSTAGSLTATYQRLIGWSLSHRLAMFAVAVIAFAGAVAMPALRVIPSEFMPNTDNSGFLVHIETPPGSSLTYTREKAMEVAALARAYTEVKFAYTVLGDDDGEVDEGDIFVQLVKRGERSRRQSEVAAALREHVVRLGGVRVSIDETGGDGNPSSFV